MVSGTLGKIHLQLRRLSNETQHALTSTSIAGTNLTGPAAVAGPTEKLLATVIPSGCSRVLFHFSGERFYADSEQQQSSTIPASPSSQSDEDRYGSVMFECGLQGLDLKAVKRISASSGDSNADVSVVEMEKNISASTLVEVETHLPAGLSTLVDDSMNSTAGGASAESENQGSMPATTAATVGSVPSQSSQMSFKQRHSGDKGVAEPGWDIHVKQATSQKQHSVIVDAAIASVNDSGVSGVHQAVGVDKDLSSCSLQIKGVWLSFAAPPRTTVSNKKSSESALLDRNLLSTASPAINAWMNSGDRLTITLLQLLRVTETRSLSVLAGLMAEALDVQQIHLPVKSKYNCLSLMSRTLQEVSTSTSYL